MEIVVQKTPNPNALKFVLPFNVSPNPFNVSTASAAAEHPLTARLFALNGVYNVFMVQDFVTVNKLPESDWAPLTDDVMRILRDFYRNQSTR